MSEQDTHTKEHVKIDNYVNEHVRGLKIDIFMCTDIYIDIPEDIS